MSSIFIDSHSHIQFPAYDNDREAVVARAREAGVKMIAVGTEAQTSEDAICAAEQFPAHVLGATVGFHPGHAARGAYHDVDELRSPAPEEFDLEKMRELARHSRVVAIGECGLDYYRIETGDKRHETGVTEKQKKFFEEQIILAQEVSKPLIIHCRSAFPDLIGVLQTTSYQLQTPAGIIHFFSGTVGDARRLMDLGFFLGFGGVITFAKAYEAVVRYAPLDKILLETDAPYVAPVPHRGTRNEPAYVIEAAKKIAELKSVSLEEAARQTTENAAALFGLR